MGVKSNNSTATPNNNMYSNNFNNDTPNKNAFSQTQQNHCRNLRTDNKTQTASATIIHHSRLCETLTL